MSSHVERLLAPLSRDAALVTVIDGHPATQAALGTVAGLKTISLGVEHFGQTGSIHDLNRHDGIDAASIVEQAGGLTAGRPIRAHAWRWTPGNRVRRRIPGGGWKSRSAWNALPGPIPDATGPWVARCKAPRPTPGRRSSTPD